MKRRLLQCLIFTSLVVFANGAIAAYADTAASQTICSGVSEVGGNCDTSNGATINGELAFVLNILAAIAGVIGVVMIIVGGAKYITASGNSEKTNQGKNTILFACVGLLVAVLAQIIVKFVLNKAALL